MTTDEKKEIALTSRLRVVRDERQWLVQRRKNTTWSNIASCRSKAGVRIHLRQYLEGRFSGGKDTPSFAILLDRYADPEAWAEFEALPDFFQTKGTTA